MKNLFNSKNVFLFICLFVTYCHFHLRIDNYNNFDNVLGWDILAYYIYLPFTFIYHDPGMTNHAIVDTIFNTYHPSGTFYQAFPLPNGNWSSMYTMGFALLYLPFFFMGHLWAKLGGYATDGFSYPYQVAISTGMFLYVLAGYAVFRKLMLRFFDDKVVAWLLVLMILGTNLFHESIIYEQGPHASLFGFFSLALLLNVNWHQNPTAKNSVFLGTILGLIMLCRGSSVMLLMVPVLWNVYDKESFVAKVKFFLEQWKKVILILASFMIFPGIQMIFWKVITGKFIFNTYQVTPGFDWLEPHVMEVLFSYKKGWLLYTPMMILAILGLRAIYKQNKKIALSVILFAVLNFYLISSWGTWWGGGSMGHRYFVESYPIMALALGYLLKSAFSRVFTKVMVLFVGGIFVFHNLFETWQFNNWIFDGYSMTKEYYWKVFLKTTVSEEDRKYRSVIRDFGPEEQFSNRADYEPHLVGLLDFDSLNTFVVNPIYLDTTHAFSGKSSAKITKDVIYGPTFQIPYNKLTDKDHAWLEISMRYLPVQDLKEQPVSLVAVMDHNKGQYGEGYFSWDLEKRPYKVGEWNYIKVYYLTPYPLSRKNDVFKIYPYLRGSGEIYIDDFKIVSYERKF